MDGHFDLTGRLDCTCGGPEADARFADSDFTVLRLTRAASLLHRRPGNRIPEALELKAQNISVKPDAPLDVTNTSRHLHNGIAHRVLLAI
jgi:hypothetical protein